MLILYQGVYENIWVAAPKNALTRSEAYVVTPLISKTEDVATIADG